MAKQTEKNEILELKNQIEQVTSILNDINLSIDVMNKEGKYKRSEIIVELSCLKSETEQMFSKYDVALM